MIRRLLAVAHVALLEAVRSKLLVAIGLVHAAGTAYAALLAALSLGHGARVVGDVSLASFSIVGLALVIVHAGTSVDLDIRRKAVLTVLTRAINRGEWIVGKYLGILAALAVYGGGAGTLSLITAGLVEGSTSRVVLAACVIVPVPAALALRRSRRAAPFAYLMPLVALAATAVASRDPGAAVFLRGASLALFEAALVAAVALLFATFSGPIPTAIFTVGVVLVGRSADALAKLPTRNFPEGVVLAAGALARCVPNLHVFVPPRPVLAGLDPAVAPRWLLAHAALYATTWCVVLLAGAILIIDRRDLA